MPAVRLTRLPDGSLELEEPRPSVAPRPRGARESSFLAVVREQFLGQRPTPPARALDPWLEIVARFLHAHVFSGRPLCLIAHEKRASDWPYLEKALAGSTELRVDGDINLVAYADAASPELLREVVYSSDFHWDAVWFAPFDGRDLARVATVIKGVRFPDPMQLPESDQEVVIPIGDGTGILWSKPNRAFEETAAAVKATAASVGWECEVVHPEPRK